MRLEYVFNLIVELEQRQIANHITWNSISLWPLIRHCLWAELLTEAQKPASTSERIRSVQKLIRRVLRYLGGQADFKVPDQSNTTLLFLSRPVYLQTLPSGKLFDRIIDPLLFALPPDSRAEKLYVSPWYGRAPLQYAARCLLAPHTPSPLLKAEDRAALTVLAQDAGLTPEAFLHRYTAALQAFSRWFESGKRIFVGRPALRTIYLTSWYFPDMMGLTASARQRGIRVIDVQHGKQGRYQAMYSGWHNLPEGSGYLAMPDGFWCWGEPSCRHILASTPDRHTHRPFVGGFPWLEFYRTKIAEGVTNHGASTPGSRVILVTTQPCHKANIEPIPDFLLGYLRSRPTQTRFIFRCHPNDAQGPEYCRQRLADIPPALFSVDLGKSNLYDQMLSATHHITAYSSCCYEASAFGVPTLLFGQDARTIYTEEIDSGEFAWTEGREADLVAWLETATPPDARTVSNRTYIESSLVRASELLAQR